MITTSEIASFLCVLATSVFAFLLLIIVKEGKRANRNILLPLTNREQDANIIHIMLI